jgi:hypothetical protein
MLLVNSDDRTEAGAMPDEKFMIAMGKFNEDLANAGKLLAAEGLHPSAKGARLKLAGGERTLTKGPFGEPRRLVAGYWIIQADSKEEAIEWAKRVPFEADEAWVASGGIGQIEVRQVFELDDFPVNEDESGWREQEAEIRTASEDGVSFTVPQASTEGITLKRFFCTTNADCESEAGKLPSEEHLAAMGEFMGEMAAVGVVLGGEGLQPSSKGALVTFSGGKRIVTDGPFIETRELIGGFGLIQAKSLDEAIDLSWRFMEVAGKRSGGESICEIRQIFEASDVPAELASQPA